MSDQQHEPGEAQPRPNPVRPAKSTASSQPGQRRPAKSTASSQPGQRRPGQVPRAPLRKPPTVVHRRTLLKKAVLGTGAVAALGAGGAEAWFHLLRKATRDAAKRTPPTTTPTVAAVSSATMDNGMPLPTAAWVAAENARPGTSAWLVAGNFTQHEMEGYASQVSAVQGDTVTLYVNTTAQTFHAEAYRLGWYGGTGARLVWTSPEVPGAVQPDPVFTSGINMVECHWSPSFTVPIGNEWPPGVYLFKLIGSKGEARWIPLTIRDDSSTAAFAVMNAVTTWQAYNLWGGYSLYFGSTGSGQDYAHRSRVVSFDRPYPLTWAAGAADLIGNELPLILLMEKNGLDVTYLTDVDLHSNPQRILHHSALLSLGHDEYWSLPMRQGATEARDSGVNLVFFGANACYRRIRLDPSPVGPYRHQICYKTDYREDPLYGVDNAQVTSNWPDPPSADPESSLIGDMYQSNPVDAALVVTEPSSWLYAGTGLTLGDKIPSAVGSEYDRYDPSVPSPTDAEILAHSPLVCRGVYDHSDVCWYTSPGGGGVLSTGTNWWISKLVDTSKIPASLMPGPFAGVTAPLTQMTLNILSAVGNGPANQTHPSVPNWQKYYSPTSATPISAGDRGA